MYFISVHINDWCKLVAKHILSKKNVDKDVNL